MAQLLTYFRFGKFKTRQKQMVEPVFYWILTFYFCVFLFAINWTDLRHWKKGRLWLRSVWTEIYGQFIAVSFWASHFTKIRILGDLFYQNMSILKPYWLLKHYTVYARNVKIVSFWQKIFPNLEFTIQVYSWDLLEYHSAVK